MKYITLILSMFAICLASCSSASGGVTPNNRGYVISQAEVETDEDISLPTEP